MSSGYFYEIIQIYYVVVGIDEADAVIFVAFDIIACNVIVAKNTNNSLLIIDTKGEMSRKKSFLTTIHGRYRTVGHTDLRAIFDSLFLDYSSKYKSSDSEAMHIIEILNHKNGVLNANIDRGLHRRLSYHEQNRCRDVLYILSGYSCR